MTSNILRKIREKNPRCGAAAQRIPKKDKQSKSRTPKGKRKENNKQENKFGDKNNLETGLK